MIVQEGDKELEKLVQLALGDGGDVPPPACMGKELPTDFRKLFCGLKACKWRNMDTGRDVHFFSTNNLRENN